MQIGSNCSGLCGTCKIHYIGGCLAGHGDDNYVYASPEWIREFIDNKYKSSNTEQTKKTFRELAEECEIP